MKVKILLVTHYYPAHRGGIEIAAGKIAQQLLKSYPVSITWMAAGTDKAPDSSENLQCLPMKAWNITEEKWGIPYPVWHPSSLAPLWQEISRADLVFLHDYLYAGNLKAYAFAKIQKKPVIVTQHIGFVPYRNIFFRALLSGLNQTLGKVMLAHAEQTVFISHAVKDYFMEGSEFKVPPCVIPNGVDHQMFHPANEEKKQALRRALGWHGKTVFLFAGRFVEKKGLGILKHLAAFFPSVHWAFAGSGPLDPSLRQLSNVKVFKDRSEASMAELYQAADLLVLPSRGEGLPLVVQEALACGTPVLIGSETAKAYPDAEKIFLTAPAELAEESTIKIWISKIESLLADPQSYKKISAAAAPFAKEHWNWGNNAAQYWKIMAPLTLTLSPGGERGM